MIPRGFTITVSSWVSFIAACFWQMRSVLPTLAEYLLPSKLRHPLSIRHTAGILLWEKTPLTATIGIKANRAFVTAFIIKSMLKFRDFLCVFIINLSNIVTSPGKIVKMQTWYQSLSYSVFHCLHRILR